MKNTLKIAWSIKKHRPERLSENINNVAADI
jgi:hypothetical protein